MKKILLISAALALLVAAFFYFYTNKSRSCQAQGGRWVQTGPLTSAGDYSVKYCYFPTPDEGKQCYQDSDCSVECVSTGKADSAGYLLGECGQYSIFDCRPTIPTKTMNKRDLKSGSCS